MKKEMKIVAVLIIVLNVCTTFLFAQKLPNIQKQSLLIPKNVKIDGKDFEWNNNYNAYNKATEIFYNLSNDDRNIYLSVKASNPVIIKKILLQGITFTITNSKKNEFNEGQSVLFPKYDLKNQLLYLNINSSNINQNKRDSLMLIYNNRIVSKLKQIEITDIKTKKSSALSIYNEENIKAYALVDKNLNLIYEISMPIQKIKDKSTIYYNIKINGASGGSEIIAIESANGTVLSYKGADGISYNLGYSTPANLALSYSTDFTGSYKLILK